VACERVVRAGLQALDDDQSKEAEVIRSELESQLTELRDESKDINELDEYSAVRVKVVAAQRKELLETRSKYEIGDDAFHQVEAQLDVAEVNAQGAEYP
jgi:monovalent cation/hydrogen antiporter